MRDLPPLNPLLAFATAARHLSFTRAADELNVTQGAVSRQVGVLEEYFGEKLFVRRHRGLALTPRGKVLAQRTGSAFDDLRAAAREFQNLGGRQTLVIKGYPLLLQNWLMPRLPEFSRINDNIDIRLVGSSGASHVDFAVDDVDLGIRYGRGAWPGLHAVLLFSDYLMPVCAPSLKDEFAALESGHLPKRDQVLMQTRARSSDWVDWFDMIGTPRPHDTAFRNFEDLSLVLQCTLRGEGIAMLQRPYIESELESGRLVAIGTPLKRPLGYYLVCPQERARTNAIAAFLDWAERQLSQ